MTSSNAVSHRRSAWVIWSVVLLIGFLLTMIVGTALAMSPGLAVQRVASPTATATPVSWAVVNIAKPTYTPSPTPTTTFTPTPAPTDVPTLVPTETPPLLTLTYPDMQTSFSNAGPSSPSSPSGKSIFVSISDQHLTAYENGQLVFSFVASTGMNHSTRAGSFSVLDKIPNAYGSTWNIWMPDWLGIYYSGTLENGIHALPILPNGNTLWAGFLGRPISFGCVVLGTNEALQLYNWADVGTPVEISW